MLLKASQKGGLFVLKDKAGGIIWMMMLVQFIGITDFMVTMPLGPQIARSFFIPVEDSAWLSGLYAIAAAVSGVLLSPLLDRYARKKLLAIFLLCSGACLLLTNFVSDYSQLLVMRSLNGFFSTPIAALSMAIAIDVSSKNRNKAMAKMSLAFSLAAIIGVPLGLYIAQYSHWSHLYLVNGLLAIGMAISCLLLLPKEQQHSIKQARLTIKEVLKKPKLRNGLLLIMTSLFAAFLFIPHLAAIFQFNFNYPVEDLADLYFLGGICTIITSILFAKYMKIESHSRYLWLVSFASIATLVFGFYLMWLPVTLIFVLFMSLNGSRNLIIQSELSQLAKPNQRAGYLSLLATVRNVTTGLAAFISAQVIQTDDSGSLNNILILCIIGTFFILISPIIMSMIIRPVKEKTIYKNSFNKTVLTKKRTSNEA